MSIRISRVGTEQKKESELNIEMEPRKFNGQKKKAEQKKRIPLGQLASRIPCFGEE